MGGFYLHVTSTSSTYMSEEDRLMMITLWHRGGVGIIRAL